MTPFESRDDRVGRLPENNLVQPPHFAFVDIGDKKEARDESL